MARIENHYNILALIIEDDPYDTAEAAIIIPDNVFTDFKNMMIESNNLLIPVLLFDQRYTQDDVIHSPAFFTEITGETTAAFAAAGGTYTYAVMTPNDDGGDDGGDS